MRGPRVLAVRNYLTGRGCGGGLRERGSAGARVGGSAREVGGGRAGARARCCLETMAVGF